jgi:hypothetical protein
LIINHVGEASEQYGNDLSEGATFPRSSSNVPVGLQLLVNPEQGFATVGDNSECVLRIRANVVANGYSVVVLKEIDAFVKNPFCLLTLDAFTDAGVLPSVVVIGDGITQQEIEQFNTALATRLQIAPGADFLPRALIAALDLCSTLDDTPPGDLSTRGITRQAFRHFDGNDLTGNPAVKTVVLQLAGRELCPEHDDAVREYLELATGP